MAASLLWTRSSAMKWVSYQPHETDEILRGGERQVHLRQRSVQAQRRNRRPQVGSTLRVRQRASV